MNERDKEAVNQAKQARQSTQEPTSRQRKQGKGQASKAEAAGKTLVDIIEEGSDRIADNLVKVMETKAAIKFNQRLQNYSVNSLDGAALEIFLETLDGINAPLEAEYIAVLDWQEAPKALLPSAS